MEKLTMRFCGRNLREEGSKEVRFHHLSHNNDLIEVQTFHCLGNCTLCNQGPFCTLNDFIFQDKDPETLNERLENIFSKLRQGLED